MKNKRWLANIDKDVLCFFVTVLLMLGAGAGVMAVDSVAKKDDSQVKKSVSVAQPCDGTAMNLQLPARTNMGDTLYVLANKNKKYVYAKKPDGTTGLFGFAGAGCVNAGDTIVYNSKHNFLMKNITQCHLAKQK